MPNPLFQSAGANLALTGAAPRERWGSPRSRHATACLPGVDGVLVARHGIGERLIHGEGYLQASGATAAAAYQALLAALRTRQSAVGRQIGTYTDAAGAAHGDCLLTAYEPASAIQTSAAPAGGSIVARVAVRYVVLQQLPD